MTVDPSGCVIRPAVRNDVPRIIELLRLGSTNPGKEDPANYQAYETALDEINTGHGALLVAELDNDVVGFIQVIVFRHFQAQGRNCAEFESFHVHPDYRSHGIGTVLLNEAEQLATAADCHRVQLTSNNSRSDAHRFYLQHGYEATHTGFKKLLGV
jgi:GNAT superfamily N-acetyltransferase